MCSIMSMARIRRGGRSDYSSMVNAGSDPVQQLSPCPSEANDYLAAHVQLLRDSLRTLNGRDLVEAGTAPAEFARQIFYAPFVVLSHNSDPDPILTYANLACMRLFAMDWHQIVKTPSRYTAEAPVREERERLLARVTADGFIDDYTGVRVSATGRRFMIENATVWNLQDSHGRYCGQAATFNRWTFLP
jgi:hypothetical protein